jgi:hypothetical protein
VFADVTLLQAKALTLKAKHLSLKLVQNKLGKLSDIAKHQVGSYFSLARTVENDESTGEISFLIKDLRDDVPKTRNQYKCRLK